MADEWTSTTLGDVASFLSGGTPPKDNPAYWEGTTPWVSAKDMKRFRLEDTEDHLTDDGILRGSKLVPAGTVFLLTRGMTLLNDIPISIAGRPMTFNQDVKALLPKPGVSDAFLPYLLLGHKRHLQDLVDLSGHGTGRLNLDQLKALKVLLPPKAEQCAIAHAVSNIDAKIELNRRMNTTLEAIARSFFKSWFVDFDPVHAKARGRNLELTKHLSDLFPGSFERSALGEVPTGWSVANLGDILTLEYGKALQEEKRRPGPFPVFGSNGQVGWHNEKLEHGPGIIVGRKGNTGTVTWVHTDFFAIDTTFFVVPKLKSDCLYFLYYSLRRHDLASLGADSAVPGLNRNMAYMSKQLVPPPAVLDAFASLTKPFFERLYRADEQSRTIAALRDTLLPKLVSGELRIRDAERIVGRHV